jgi:hypothetical protein
MPTNFYDDEVQGGTLARRGKYRTYKPEEVPAHTVYPRTASPASPEDEQRQGLLGLALRKRFKDADNP